MKKFSIKALARIIKAHPMNRVSRISTGRLSAEYRESSFTGVSTDSRTTQAGDCFFAIAGDNFDGHDFFADAFARGAACAVVSRDIRRGNFTGDCVLKVDDTIKALGDFAAEYRRRANFKVVAIAGSVGKTTTRQIAYHVLSRHYRVHQAPKNFNNNIGLPLTLLGADPEDKIVIVELGSNHPGEIAYLTQIALPDIAVVTNVHPAHLAGFGSIQTITKEKLSISEGLPSDGILIINADIANRAPSIEHRASSIEIIAFGKSDGCDIQAQNITCKTVGSEFTIDGTNVALPLPGMGGVENALAAWSVCSRFGISIDDFACAVKTLPPVPMRAELMQIGRLSVLNDCYNANPASMKNALDILVNLGINDLRLPIDDWKSKIRNRKSEIDNRQSTHRLVFICGDMAELGQQTNVLHSELGASIAQAKVQLLLTVGKLAKITAEAAKKFAEHNLQTKSFEDTPSACNNLEKFIKDSDIILVKGSRPAKLEMAIEKLKELFA